VIYREAGEGSSLTHKVRAKIAIEMISCLLRMGLRKHL